LSEPVLRALVRELPVAAPLEPPDLVADGLERRPLGPTWVPPARVRTGGPCSCGDLRRPAPRTISELVDERHDLLDRRERSQPDEQRIGQRRDEPVADLLECRSPHRRSEPLHRRPDVVTRVTCTTRRWRPVTRVVGPGGR